MKALIRHLRSLIRINRQILNRLHKDEASLELLREAFSNRKKHIEQLDKIIPGIDTVGIAEKEAESLKALFDRFAQQSEKIQEALDYIIQKSQEELQDAVKRRKAEESYQLLK